ncbi:hypothetical protein OGAPHI_002287 [Ogataea philodendri]|uniref:protein-serine/threonine phosphatase n=1 Tax=Ogataea philodendri TaxID=1378263 RepID=A0A9P8PAD9_9ASCO|nr:uncharacterized protein OGAPHI_002287 [Ogataea philodendri]KAH3668533.1 hypothetical protein OGAPHI_002287 [Ogataea philodendri]
MGQLLSQPITEKNITLVQHDHISHSIGEMQGYRLTMEDAYCDMNETIHLQNKEHDIVKDSHEVGNENGSLKINIYGVFDGHGGSGASKFVSQALPTILREELVREINELSPESKEDLISCKDVLNHINFPKLLKSSYMKCDSMFYHRQDNNSGTTAVVLLIFCGYVFVANCGDSRCILSQNGSTKLLSFDHKPRNLGELMRIHNGGGYVSANRVNSILALSRALGDFTFKMHSDNDFPRRLLKSHSNHKVSPPEEFQVTAEPDIIVHKSSPMDEFLVVACDGIWDCYKSHELIHLIRHQLSLGKKLPEINEIILDNCIKMANTITGIGFDNMTLIIIALHQDHNDLNAWYNHMKYRILDERFGTLGH